MKITVLSENTGCEKCEGEHGLSLYISFDSYKILLDAGQSSLFLENARKLHIDLAEVDFAILSHSHYDHADGFSHFFEVNEHAPLYVRKEVSEIYYSMHEEGLKYIGPKVGMLQKYEDRILFVNKEFFPLENGSMFLIPHSTKGLHTIGEKAKLFRKEKDSLLPDDFSHEQSLVINTDRGLVIFNSCSHGGPATIMNEVQKYNRTSKIYAYIGGFHLSKYSNEDVLAFADTLKNAEVERIITGHCTGHEAFEILRNCLGDKVEEMHSGMEILL